MRREELIFARPASLQATAPPEERGLARDEVRLLISSAAGQQHAHFYELANFLRRGDLLVVNNSATLPASLPAAGEVGRFIVNLSTNYGQGLWLAEPRYSAAKPGPLPLHAGERIQIAGLEARLVAPHPGIPRLWFIQVDGWLEEAMVRMGQPIHYGYVERSYPLAAYQTIFARVPGSAEMPSAARPFSQRVLDSLHRHGVQFAEITLHTGVSSLEVEEEEVEQHILYAEPFRVPAATAEAVNAAHNAGRRVIAAGTTVVRALESAWDGAGVRAVAGFTRRYVHPANGVHVIDGLLSGLHDPLASHLAMLYAIAGPQLIRAGYAEAIRAGYLWHEFGDSHLIIADCRL